MKKKEKNSDHDPLNSFQDPLMGDDPQFGTWWPGRWDRSGPGQWWWGEAEGAGREQTPGAVSAGPDQISWKSAMPGISVCSRNIESCYVPGTEEFSGDVQIDRQKSSPEAYVLVGGDER